MKSIIFPFVISLLLSFISFAQEEVHNPSHLKCSTCHTREVPTKDDPGLINCPRPMMKNLFPTSNLGPAVFILKDLENKYLPVVFEHKLHAQMSEMTGGCLNCHHFNTSGPIMSCNQCHLKERKRDDVSKPDLMAAYHQQCLDCHRQWSHQTECTSCHAEKKGNETIDASNISSDLLKKTHPEVKKPEKIIFKTDAKEGSIVTFYHDEHSSLFGLDCVSCHKDENCIGCHDLEKVKDGKNINFDMPVKVNVSETERHQRCFGCHVDNQCSFCHKNSAMKRFNHAASTGWALNKNHINLACTVCHKKGKEFTALDNKCISCHPDWNSMSFNHKVTGLVLNETHSEFECGDCHLNKDFSTKPSCENCHDDKSFPKDKPGTLVN